MRSKPILGGRFLAHPGPAEMFYCPDPPSTNRSLPVLEPVCERRKRKLKKGDQRRAAEAYRLGAGSSPFVRQETRVRDLTSRSVGVYTRPRPRRFWLAGHIGFEPVSVRSVGRFEPPHGGIKIRCFEQWDYDQKGLDFLGAKSVTVGGRRAPSTLPGSCPAGFRAWAGL
jgi:hypothetical protein